MNPESDPARERLLEGFFTAVDHGDRRRARKVLAKLVAQRDDADVAWARWRLASIDDDLQPAIEIAREGIARFPEAADLHHALGVTLLDMERAAAALPHLEEACFLDPDFVDAWYDLALTRAEVGDEAGMRQAFTEVYEIDTHPDQPPMRYQADRVDAWAERALLALPPEVREAARNVTVIVQDYPDRWILDSAPWDPRLLGLFDGPVYAEVQGWDDLSGVVATPHVYLYQRNLERVCADSREMALEVRITVHHEVGHFLGLDEDDLHERGLG